jgi:hypothetical protein
MGIVVQVVMIDFQLVEGGKLEDRNEMVSGADSMSPQMAHPRHKCVVSGQKWGAIRRSVDSSTPP